MWFVNRRDFLCATGFVFVTSTSGCLSGGSDADVDSRFAGEGCPSFEDSDETRCYHEVGTEPDVYLVPEQEAGNPAEEAMTFILHNDSDSAVWSTPLSVSWDLYKFIDDEWRLLTPFRTVPLVNEPLDPGGFHTWSLEMSNDVGMSERLSPEDSDMAYTGMGRYAFEISVSTEDGGGGDEIGLVALFDVDGEPLELDPIGVENHEREDGTVRVRLEREENGEAEAVVAARRAEGAAEDVEPTLSEIAAQLHPVRNTLAFFDDETEEIRLVGGMSLMKEMEQLRRAANISSGARDQTLIEVTEDGPVGDFPYRFRFLHDGIYYELTVEESLPES